MSEGAPRFLNSGDTALVVEFGDTVDPEINDRVVALDEALRSLALDGVRETVPTYRSLMIHYEPLVIDRATLIARVKDIESRSHARREPSRRWIVPCCYDPACAEDIAPLSEALGLTPQKIEALHSSATYRIYMYGFAPGFTYLGGLPPELAISRRAVLRPPIPPNAIIIGGGLAVIATFPMPTGWYVIGRTPERMFSSKREPAFLVDPGDELRFESIDLSTFEALDARSAAGEVVAKCERLR